MIAFSRLSSTLKIEISEIQIRMGSKILTDGEDYPVFGIEVRC